MDPNATYSGPARLGGIPASTQSAEFATVLSVDPHNYSYAVRTLRGRSIAGVPRKRNTPDDIALLPVGASVIVRFDLGVAYIDGVLDLPAGGSDNPGIPGSGGTAFADGAVHVGNTGNYRAPHEPTDLIPGDTLTGNAGGARVGTLQGGVAVLKAGELAQIRAHVLGDMLELISRNFRQVTDMGVFEVKNRAGKVNMSFRGASDQLGEAGATEENWTVRFDLGSEGDMFRFELTTPSGQTLFRIHVDSEGRCEIFGLDGVVLSSGARSGEKQVSETAGDTQETVHGSVEKTVGGSCTATCAGDTLQVVDGNASVTVGGDATVASTRDIGVAAGRSLRVVAAGDATNDEPAVSLDAQHDLHVSVGVPSNPGAKARLETLQGDIDVESTQGGTLRFKTVNGVARTEARKIVLKTSSGDSVVLGGDSIVAHLTRFEQLETLVRALARSHDLHTHLASGSATSTPTVSMWASIQNLIRPCKSTRVGVAG